MSAYGHHPHSLPSAKLLSRRPPAVSQHFDSSETAHSCRTSTTATDVRERLGRSHLCPSSHSAWATQEKEKVRARRVRFTFWQNYVVTQSQQPRIWQWVVGRNISSQWGVLPLLLADCDGWQLYSDILALATEGRRVWLGHVYWLWLTIRWYQYAKLRNALLWRAGSIVSFPRGTLSPRRVINYPGAHCMWHGLAWPNTSRHMGCGLQLSVCVRVCACIFVLISRDQAGPSWELVVLDIRYFCVTFVVHCCRWATSCFFFPLFLI